MNEYKIRKAVITGGSGGVGIALIQKLISENVEVVVFQRKDSKRKNNLPKHKLLKIEYCSLEELKDYCPKETGYDVFFIWDGQTHNAQCVTILMSKIKM